MDILNFIVSNYDNLIALGAIIFLIYLLFRTGNKEQLFSVIISLMAEAEKVYGGGTGKLKQQDVLNKLPMIYKILYSNKSIKTLIDDTAYEYGALFDKINKTL